MKIRYLFLFSIILIAFIPAEKCSAGYINGDEHLGGLSLIMDHFDDPWNLPDEYQNLLEKGFELFPKYKIENEQYEILCRIVEAEATGGTVEQKKNVASCILARVDSGRWGKDIKAVVFQNDGKTWQFSPISDGRYYTVKITDTTKEAVDDVLMFGKTHSYEYFCTKASYEKENSWHRKHLTYGFYDGEHVYCQ